MQCLMIQLPLMGHFWADPIKTIATGLQILKPGEVWCSVRGFLHCASECETQVMHVYSNRMEIKFDLFMLLLKSFPPSL